MASQSPFSPSFLWRYGQSGLICNAGCQIRFRDLRRQTSPLLNYRQLLQKAEAYSAPPPGLQA